MNPAQRDTSEHDTPMTGIYVAVVVVEATLIALLFLLGRLYS